MEIIVKDADNMSFEGGRDKLKDGIVGWAKLVLNVVEELRWYIDLRMLLDMTYQQVNGGKLYLEVKCIILVRTL